MREINSKDNRIYKDALKLSQKKYRDKEGVYLVEGENLVGEALKYTKVLRIFVDKDKLSKYEELGILHEIEKKQLDVFMMDSKLFEKISATETSQGIIAVCQKRVYSDNEIKEIMSTDRNFVVLDRLQDPGNIGTIIRTAEGAGYSAIVTLKGTADVFSPKTIRAAAGSVFRNPIIQVEDNRDLRELCNKYGKKLTVTCFDTDNYYYDEDISRNVCLVIGNEGNGVSDELIEMADIKIKIPMFGNLESLNASVAAGILMYEAARK